MFVTTIHFRGTYKSLWDLTEVSEQSWYEVLTYELVIPTFKISLLKLLIEIVAGVGSDLRVEDNPSMLRRFHPKDKTCKDVQTRHVKTEGGKDPT